MYDSNTFDKNDMLEWEKQPISTKTNWLPAKAYFKDLIKATDTYLQNVGRNTSSRNRYESASNIADAGDEIREYIARIATTAQGNNHASQFNAMAAQIKVLTEAVEKLSAGARSSNENVNPNTARP